MEPDREYIYWTFTAAAQSIAAFVALLLAGYALVHQLMAAAREEDETLEEVHRSLQETYHKRLVFLGWTTGIAIVGSLAVVYTNSMPFWGRPFLVAVIAAFDLTAIAAGLTFAVSIVNPRKYRTRASKELEEVQEKIKPTGKKEADSVFFHAFIELEKIVRDTLHSRDLYIPSRGVPRMSYSFRRMVDALYQNELISARLRDELLEVNKYRNLVFHGHVSEVDRAMLERVEIAKQHLAEELVAKNP